MKKEYIPAAIFDGFALIMRTDMIRKAGGIDKRYLYHHIYDRELSLLSLACGYKNIVLNVYCHHVGGGSAGKDYDTWSNSRPEIPANDKNADSWLHTYNTKIFEEKWKDYLPIYIEEDFSFRNGQYVPNIVFKGDKIFGCKKGDL